MAITAIKNLYQKWRIATENLLIIMMLFVNCGMTDLSPVSHVRDADATELDYWNYY